MHTEPSQINLRTKKTRTKGTQLNSSGLRALGSEEELNNSICLMTHSMFARYIVVVYLFHILVIWLNILQTKYSVWSLKLEELSESEEEISSNQVYSNNHNNMSFNAEFLKCIPEFDGNPSELHRLISTSDSIINNFYDRANFMNAIYFYFIFSFKETDRNSKISSKYSVYPHGKN